MDFNGHPDCMTPAWLTRANGLSWSQQTPTTELHETAPLLPKQSDRRSDRTAHSKKALCQSPATIRAILFLGVFVMGCGEQLFVYPQTRIFESVICYDHYETQDPSRIKLGRDAIGPGAIGGVDEMWCKVTAVQTELATLLGYQNLFDGIPGLLLALPFGWAADTFGRWLFLLLPMLSTCLRASWVQFVTWNWQRLDVRWAWASAAFTSLGGGTAVLGSMVLVVISDVTAQEERAAAYFRIIAAEIAANICMPPMAAFLMDINPWIPSLGGTCLMVIPTLLLFALPETLGYQDKSGAAVSAPGSTSQETLHERERPTLSTIAHIFDRSITEIKSACAVLTRDWRIIALTLPFFVHAIAVSLSQLLLQYTSTRYHLTFATGTLLLTVQNGVRLVLFFLILPLLSKWLVKSCGLSCQKKDLFLARANELLMMVGWISVGLSPNVPWFVVSLTVAALGLGSSALLRSFLLFLIPSEYIARVFTLISLVTTLGQMLGMPVLAELFKKGLDLGSNWVGLPFCFTGLLSAVMAINLFCIRPEKRD